MEAGRKKYDLTIGIAFLGFIALGLPDGLLGVAWPSIRAEYDLPQSAIGGYLGALTLAIFFVSLNGGTLVRRFGIGKLLAGAYALRGLAMAAVLIAPSWETVVLTGFVTGLGGGAIDTGLNIYVADYKSPRLMNWLHAFFGVGATISPLIVTSLLDAGLTWRYGFVFVGVVNVVMGLAFLLTLTRWQRKVVSDDDGTSGGQGQAAGPLQTARMPIAWLGIFAFFIYAGIEVSAGQWSFSVFTESRGIDPTAAGVWVSLYWGTFTFGRFLFGIFGDAFSVKRQLRTALVGIVLSALLFWWNPLDILGMMGLTVLGFACAPVFPVLVSATMNRVGPRHADNAIGFQMGAASAGVGVLPWLAGVFVERTAAPGTEMLSRVFPINTEALTSSPSLEVVGAFLFVLAVILVALHEGIVRLQRQGKRAAAAAAIAGSEPAPSPTYLE